MLFLLIVIALPTMDIFWWRRADRRARSLPRARIWRASVAIFALFVLGGFVLLMLTRGLRLDLPIPRAALVVLYAWHLIVMPGCAIVIGLTAIFSALRHRKLRPMESSDQAAQNGTTLTRRSFLATSAAIAVPPLLAGSGLTIARPQLDSFRVRHLTIPLRTLPRELDGLTIAQVSDVHVGRFTRASLLPRIAEATNQLRADLVLLTGDLIDWSLTDLPAGIDMVRQLDPRSGLVMIEGNHDLFQSRTEFDQGVQRAGIDLLLNEVRDVRVRGRVIRLGGIQWGSDSPRSADIEDQMKATLPRLMENAEAFPILLAHHPHAFDLAAAADVPLTLAGHTHGGQLMLTKSFGAGSIMYRYWSGLYRMNNSALVVSNGVGNWFPIRVNAPAEIVHLTLRSA